MRAVIFTVLISLCTSTVLGASTNQPESNCDDLFSAPVKTAFENFLGKAISNDQISKIVISPTNALPLGKPQPTYLVLNEPINPAPIGVTSDKATYWAISIQNKNQVLLVSKSDDGSIVIADKKFVIWLNDDEAIPFSQKKDLYESLQAKYGALFNGSVDGFAWVISFSSLSEYLYLNQSLSELDKHVVLDISLDFLYDTNI